MKQKNSVVQMVSVAMLSSIAYLLMMLDFPFPGFPPFLKIDFSDIPALIAAIVFSPIAGVVVEGIKNILYYGVQGSLTGFQLEKSQTLLRDAYLLTSGVPIPKTPYNQKFNNGFDARNNYDGSYHECVKLLHHFTSVHVVFKFASYVERCYATNDCNGDTAI